MPVPSSINQLSQTPGMNSPSGSESPSLLDNYDRQQQAFIAMLRDGQGFSTPLDLASAGTTDIGAQASHFLRITGSTSITSFGTVYNGPRFLVFGGALTLTHNATSLIIPGGANITTAAGDCAIVAPNLATPTGWRVIMYQRASGGTVSADLSQATGVLPTANGGTGVNDGSNLAQPGDIKIISRTTVPNGWMALPLVPTNVLRASYPALFAAYQADGFPYGAGDGSTTFGIPYMPANYTALQANGNVGTETTGDVKSHLHSVGLLGGSVTAASGANFSAIQTSSGINSGSTGGSANLAAGVRFLWILKL